MYPPPWGNMLGGIGGNMYPPTLGYMMGLHEGTCTLLRLLRKGLQGISGTARGMPCPPWRLRGRGQGTPFPRPQGRGGRARG